MDECEVANKFSAWLQKQVIDDGRGASYDELEIEPGGRFWLGTLVPEEIQLRLDSGDRGERLDPSATGLRFQPAQQGPWEFAVTAQFRIWREVGDVWAKSELGAVTGRISVDADRESDRHLTDDLDDELERLVGSPGLSAEIRTDLVWTLDHPAIEVTLVNTSPEKVTNVDTRLYEVVLRIQEIAAIPFELEALPDSFRYDRRVPAYGINCGVVEADGELVTTDVVEAEQRRPSFWNAPTDEPDLRFATLATDPLPSLRALTEAHGSWGEANWGATALATLRDRDGWTEEMERAANEARADFAEEHARLAAGLKALEADRDLRTAFELTNQALIRSSRGRYDRWRAFQIGFVLATVPSVANPTGETSNADIVWFATGGGKTETYLGLTMMAALYDRLTGKSTGVTAWSRFPLRLLSLQQTQRFADALAAAELVRREHEIGGDPFSVGFLVGEGSTPNRILEDPTEEWHPDPEDPEMPKRFRVLMVCPFCFEDSLEMGFDHEFWTLEHRCTNAECPWSERALPFYVVDDEIYRFLPTVVVGTLDKIASISLQTSMAGLIGPPKGVCAEPGHGYTYAKRSKKPSGCLVPGCGRSVDPLPIDGERYSPTFRLQDEIHLLRDSLGAVDAHYEALLDHLQLERTGRQSKILGSSATLSGYEHQVEVLYQRHGRVFPVQGPQAEAGFWTATSASLARRHIALAPRGSTLEFANDRIVTVLQQSVRRLTSEPAVVCAEAGISNASAAFALDLFGTNVVYGNTIRDLDAAARSLETQIPVDGPLNTASLTGQTDFEEVRRTLDRLQDAEPDFDDRIHVVTASSMMSHGVDIDRLNLMVVLGLPLTTAEYIQTTARVGRRWPGIVFVLHKMARERDASTYRAWAPFVRQGDRFVEPIPITRRSRRVLDKTLAGLVLGRLLQYHEPKTSQALTTVRTLRTHAETFDINSETEFAAIASMLGLDGPLDEPVRESLAEWLDHFFENLDDPASGALFPSELCPGGGAMRSLRDVEQQAPIRDTVLEERRR